MNNPAVAFALLCIFCVSLPHGASGAELAKSIAPIHLQVPLEPVPFKGNSRVGLAYELHLSNYRNIEFTLSLIEVFSIDDPNHPLAVLAGAELLACLLRPGKPRDFESPEIIRGGEFAVVCLWITLEEGTLPPATIAHRVLLSRRMSDQTDKEYVVEGAVTYVSTEEPVTINPPLPPGRWLMANGPSMLGEHRLFLHVLDGTASNTQRFASDWMLLGSDGRLVADAPESNEGWYSYGVPVLAVADGIVADLCDGIPENVPLSGERAVPNKRETMTGNYVVLKIGDKNFAFYGHLQPGNLQVQVGDHVRVGQTLGFIGNSGNSDAPHLHFHVADGSDPLSGEGLPLHLTSFAVLDELDVETWEHMLVEDSPWQPPADRQPEMRTDEMPIGEAIIEFH
jgi:hypothetical protein